MKYLFPAIDQAARHWNQIANSEWQKPDDMSERAWEAYYRQTLIIDLQTILAAARALD